MLVFESLTPQDLLKEVAEYIRESSQTSFYAGAKGELEVLAQSLEKAGLLPAESIFRTPPPVAAQPQEKTAREIENLERERAQFRRDDMLAELRKGGKRKGSKR